MLIFLNTDNYIDVAFESSTLFDESSIDLNFAYPNPIRLRMSFKTVDRPSFKKTDENQKFEKNIPRDVEAKCSLQLSDKNLFSPSPVRPNKALDQGKVDLGESFANEKAAPVKMPNLNDAKKETFDDFDEFSRAFEIWRMENVTSEISFLNSLAKLPWPAAVAKWLERFGGVRVSV